MTATTLTTSTRRVTTRRRATRCRESPARSRCCLCFRRATAAAATTPTIRAPAAPDSILSPATAKDVISVGAIQEMRGITNSVTNADGTVSQPWLAETYTSYRIAGFSSRGNVGIGIEGTFGRFKPDVVAPGTFIVSTRSSEWDTNTYFYQNPTNDEYADLRRRHRQSGLAVGQRLSRSFPATPLP